VSQCIRANPRHTRQTRGRLHLLLLTKLISHEQANLQMLILNLRTWSQTIHKHKNRELATIQNYNNKHKVHLHYINNMVMTRQQSCLVTYISKHNEYRKSYSRIKHPTKHYNQAFSIIILAHHIT
jgi:hypothetical protein